MREITAILLLYACLTYAGCDMPQGMARATGSIIGAGVKAYRDASQPETLKSDSPVSSPPAKSPEPGPSAPP